MSPPPPIVPIAPPAGLNFEDATASSAVSFAYRNGQEADHCSILESLGGGVGMVDFDRDGWMDLCFPGGGGFGPERQIHGAPTGLFRNLGGLRFADVAASSRLAAAPRYTHGAAVGDYNNDGFGDLLITAYGGVLLWTNQGDGTFVESARQAGVDSRQWSSSAAWGDLNGDGALDFYLANYVNWSFDNDPVCRTGDGRREICSPQSFEPLADAVFFNRRDGAFDESSESAGLRTDGKGLGVVLADLDLDGDLDAYVANDTTPNFCYVNSGDGRLDEIGAPSGAAVDDRGIPNGSMGVDILDFNRDGLPDIWVANYEGESFALYRNEGDAFFLHVSQPTGITAIGQRLVGFGAVCADFDLDGHVIKYPTKAPRRQIPLVLENREGRFRRADYPAQTYLGRDHEGRGLAAADLDNDGDLDLAASHLNDPVAVLRNDCDGDQWFAVRLIGTVSNRDAIGARLTLHTSRGPQLRQIKGGGSYLSSGDPRVYWGFAAGEEVEKLTIEWPSGASQIVDAPQAGKIMTFIEPQQTAPGK